MTQNCWNYHIDTWTSRDKNKMTGLRDPDHQISLGWSGPAPAFRCGGPDQPREIWWSGSRNPVVLLSYHLYVWGPDESIGTTWKFVISLFLQPYFFRWFVGSQHNPIDTDAISDLQIDNTLWAIWLFCLSTVFIGLYISFSSEVGLKMDWIGFHLLNDDTHHTGHISRLNCQVVGITLSLERQKMLFDSNK